MYVHRGVYNLKREKKAKVKYSQPIYHPTKGFLKHRIFAYRLLNLGFVCSLSQKVIQILHLDFGHSEENGDAEGNEAAKKVTAALLNVSKMKRLYRNLVKSIC